MSTYEQRVRAYEAQGMTRSDAQGIVDLEDMRAAAMTPTPTKGPWTVKGRYYRDQFRAEWIDPNICEMVSSRSPEETTANAAYIVRACNAHEELLICLNRIRGEVKLPPDIYKWVDDLLAANEEGRA